MRIFADLHIHSRFSRATSMRINVGEIARFAKVKGLNLVGTGDFTHPTWMEELRQGLVETSSEGLFQSARNLDSAYFMITGEVSTVFRFRDEAKKIHHLILTPSFDTAAQINDRLSHYGDLSIDGRPTLDMTGPQLVEEVMTASENNEVIPAHVWTPWFSMFGAFSGFERVEDCYQDMTKCIHAVETGLSSDPAMNWRLSSLDKFTLLSNSDSHSCWPWRIGREANVLDLKQLSYYEILDVIRRKDQERFKFTIETDPAYGKYHWTGHRNCNVSLPPQEAMRFNSYCPVCHRKLTKGVEQRVEELADRPPNFEPENAIGFMRLLPLSEIIAAVLNVSSPSLKSVWDIYSTLTKRFHDEYGVLIYASKEDMSEVVDPQIAEAIISVREGRFCVTPGYDGVYGQLTLLEEEDANGRKANPHSTA